MKWPLLTAIVAGAALSGAGVGALAVAHVFGRVEPMIVQACPAGFVNSQRDLANRARRAGDTEAEVRNRLNIAEAEDGVGWAWVARARPRPGWRLLAGMPLTYEGLRMMEKFEPEKREKGRAVMRAYAHGAAALAMEDAGDASGAKVQWGRAHAAHPSPRSRDSLRRSAEIERRGAFPHLAERLESLNLDITDPEEHEAASAEVRELMTRARGD